MRKRTILIWFVFVFVFSVFSVLSLHPQDSNCMTADCHKEFKKLKQLHAPVEDDCTSCHTQKEKHKFTMPDKTAICLDCHEGQKKGKHIHAAMESVECTGCHNPHGGSTKAFTKTEKVEGVCYECHEKAPMTRKFVHGPMGLGNCSLCHNPHSSDYEDLLKSSPETVCTVCHTDKDFSGEKMHKHAPLEEGCRGCHDSHSSDFQYQLVTAPGDLCGTCHDDMVAEIKKAGVKHPVMDEDKKCLNCHDAHGSKFEKLLEKSPLALCIDCHNKPIMGTDGKDYNIYKIVSKNPNKHGPVEDGNCSGCHNPHGSDFYKILIKDYPEAFYTVYEAPKYDLCFQCHDDAIMRNPETTTETDFRDGSQNLHYLHVNRRKGRTCRACHEVHAGTQPRHIRPETPFGKWDIPMNFEKTAAGGSCAPGCHKPFTYNREKKQG